MPNVVAELARRYLDHFTSRTRTDGTTFYSLKDHDSTPAELRDLLFAAHDGLLPDDHKYRFVVDALCAIADANDPDDMVLEPDPYTGELTAWLTSHLNRVHYLTEALELGSEDGFRLLALAQWCERREVFDTVRSTLETIANNEKPC